MEKTWPEPPASQTRSSFLSQPTLFLFSPPLRSNMRYALSGVETTWDRTSAGLKKKSVFQVPPRHPCHPPPLPYPCAAPSLQPSPPPPLHRRDSATLAAWVAWARRMCFVPACKSRNAHPTTTEYYGQEERKKKERTNERSNHTHTFPPACLLGKPSSTFCATIRQEVITTRSYTCHVQRKGERTSETRPSWFPPSRKPRRTSPVSFSFPLLRTRTH